MGKHFIVFAAELNSEVDLLCCSHRVEEVFDFCVIRIIHEQSLQSESLLQMIDLIPIRRKFREILVNIEKAFMIHELY